MTASSTLKNLGLVSLFISAQIGFVSASFAQTVDTNNKITAGEKDGKFYDDSLPIELALARPYAPKPEGSCSKKEWEEGYHQGLSGQRYVLPIRFKEHGGGKKEADYSTSRADRMACQSYRDIDGKNTDKLNCCIKGFFKALPAVAKEIAALEEMKKKPARLENCNNDFSEGAAVARVYCSGIACPSPPQDPIRYMGCFSLGFYQELAKCDQKDKASAALNAINPYIDASAINVATSKHNSSVECKSEHCSQGNIVFPEIPSLSAK